MALVSDGGQNILVINPYTKIIDDLFSPKAISSHILRPTSSGGSAHNPGPTTLPFKSPVSTDPSTGLTTSTVINFSVSKGTARSRPDGSRHTGTTISPISNSFGLMP